MSGDSFKVVIAGGGVAALEATLALRALAEERVSTEVVAPEPDFVYRPLSVADPFRVGETRRFPLAQLVEGAGARLHPGRVVAVDSDDRVVVTQGGKVRSYDAVLIALGARPREAVGGALTFSGPESGQELRGLLDEVLAGVVRRVVFALPPGVTWPLPLYELALLTRLFAVDHFVRGFEVIVVSPEDRPLSLFGERASETLAELLEDREIDLRLRTIPGSFEHGELRIAPGGSIRADRVVALPRLEGPRVEGLPSDREGFLPVDDRCRVGIEVDVYAAGDATQYPLKQGGIAAQMADVAAAGIAQVAGAPVEPQPFRPVLRGLLLTGMAARFLRSEPGGRESEVDTEALWAPPAKVVGRYLSSYLATRLGLSETFGSPPGGRPDRPAPRRRRPDASRHGAAAR